MPLRNTVRNVSELAIVTPMLAATAGLAITAVIAAASRSFFISFLLHIECPVAPDDQPDSSRCRGICCRWLTPLLPGGRCNRRHEWHEASADCATWVVLPIRGSHVL